MPVATFIGASKGAVAMVENSQPGLEQAASAVGATIGTGLVTAFTGFIGFFLGFFLLIISYFLLRTSRVELIEIQKGITSNGSGDGVIARIPQSVKYALITMLSIEMLMSAFSTIISSPEQETDTSSQVKPDNPKVETSDPSQSITGKLKSFICGDNCYVTINSAGKDLDFLCNTRLCDEFDETTFETKFAGKEVVAVLSMGKQVDDSGNVMGEMESVTEIVFKQPTNSKNNIDIESCISSKAYVYRTELGDKEASIKDDVLAEWGQLCKKGK